jgi:hypothetical protein
MVSALRRQVGPLCVRGPFYVLRIVEMRDGWHMLCMDGHSLRVEPHAVRA